MINDEELTAYAKQFAEEHLKNKGHDDESDQEKKYFLQKAAEVGFIAGAKWAIERGEEISRNGEG
jgi:hypothetical protein